MDIPTKKRDEIMLAARELFWKHGFKRVSIDEICRKANVSRMTFYKYFPDKISLAKTIFDRVVGEGEKSFREIMNEDSPPTEKIKKLILMKLESTNNISREFLHDFYAGPGELRDYVEERTKKAWDLLVTDFKEAQEAGVFRKDFKPELIIKIQSKISELIEDRSVTSLYDSQQDLIMEFAKFMFWGIAPHE